MSYQNNAVYDVAEIEAKDEYIAKLEAVLDALWKMTTVDEMKNCIRAHSKRGDK